MSRSHSLRELYLSRIREFYRQPARIFWVYGFPTVLAIGLGLAFRSRPPESIQLDLVASGSSAVEKTLRDYDVKARRESRPGLQLKVGSADAANRRLLTGKTPLVIEPKGSQVIYRYDPTRPEGVAARGAVDDILQSAHGRVDPLATEDIKVTEPGSRYIDFLIPGLIGLNTMGGGLWGIGFLLVNFRVAKLLKCFVATPMPRRNFLLALIGARLTFLLPDLGVLLLLGTLAFQMPIHGSLLLVIVVDVMGALAFAGIGLLIGSRAQSTETVSGLMNLVMLPMWLFSGVFFSSERFPDVAQPFIKVLPLTQLISALRLVILEGAGWLDVAPALAILAVWAVGSFYLALRIFRWT
ncbi:ABC-2 family transporter protein [Singulisphaera sp. GP187]|uniref:ABC transporter permease n=1 Tax=Singulisphaera sp. GP187 TaxID=1882752 RepID=UPI000927D1B1|nr:ABC transporter permease [Singulisphaera sp. GP187]SIO65297.1 ABC-2 family transporter protein [Singulisphaera sp. GP187]